MNRIFIGVVVVLVALIASISLYASNRATRVEELEGSLATAQKALVEAEWELAKLQESWVATQWVLTEREDTRLVNETKAKEIKAKVDNAEVRKNEGTITDVQYKSELIDSMWDSYCNANKTATSCTSRQPAKGL